MSSPSPRKGGKGGKSTSPKPNKKDQEQAARAAKKEARAQKKAAKAETGRESPDTNYDPANAAAAAKPKSKPKPTSPKLAQKKGKAKMRVSGDVRDRIIWDKSLDRTQFTVGYEDRFKGVMEKPFDAFNWADFVTLSHTETAIPLHRIVHFKYRQRIIWDRHSRVDDVFGSQGGSTIDQVIANYDPSLYPDPVPGDGADGGDDDADRGAPHLDGGATAAPAPRVFDADEDRPNYFVSLRVRSAKVVKSAQLVQDGAVGLDDRLADGVIPPEKLHITLLTLRIDPDDADDRDAASIALEQGGELLAEYFPVPSRITLSGVAAFRDRVLHAKVHPIDHAILVRFQQELRQVFVDDNLLTAAGEHGQYNPHMTLLKLSRDMCRTLGSIDPRTYAGFTDMFELGPFEVEGLELCKMGKETDTDGFYARLCPGVSNLPWDSTVGTQVTSIHNLPCSAVSADLFKPQTVVIVRGVPGSGKSTVVRKLVETYQGPPTDVVVCSADHHMVNQATGAYEFDHTRLPEAHAACQAACFAAILDHSALVIIDNTNVAVESYAEYERMAVNAAYRIEIMECVCPTKTAVDEFAARCTHGVPLSSVASMRKKWVRDPRAYRVDTRVSERASSPGTSLSPRKSTEVEAGTLWQGGLTMPTIKRLCVFDFDKTLCNTVDKGPGVPLWEATTGKKWAKRGWVSHPESLLPPLPLPPGPALSLWPQCAGRLDTECVVMSGRLDDLRNEFELALSHLLPGDTAPNRVVLKPRECNASTPSWKEGELREMVRQLPALEKVVVIDDDPKVLSVFSSLATEFSTNGGPIIKVVDALSIKSDETLIGKPLASFLAARGLLHTPRTAANAEHALQFISEVWRGVLVQENAVEVADTGSKVLYVYGGYTLGRVGDVDVCLLAPLWWNAKQCVALMEAELARRGIAWVYVAHSSRCPRLRVRLPYSNSSGVDIDLVFALVVDEDGNTDPQIGKPQPLHSTGISPGHDGLAFAAHVAATLSERSVDPAAFGMAVEMAVAMLSAHNLKGNHFHALRTCHVVEVARGTVERGEGLSRGMVSAERIFHALTRRAAQMNRSEWDALVGEFCPTELLDEYPRVFSRVAEILDRTGESAVSFDTYDKICRPCAFPHSGHRMMNFTMVCPDSILNWKAGIYARGRLPTSFRALLAHVPGVAPGPTLLGSTISWSIPDSPEAIERARSALSGFVGEMVTYCGATATIELTIGEPGELNPVFRRLPSNASDALVQGISDIDALILLDNAQDSRELLPMISSERFFVHRYAKQRGLNSKSLGDGEDRRVIVFKVSQ